MKKLLCLMLAIMMMLSSFSMTLAEDVVEVVTETPAPTEAVVTEPEPASEPAQPVVTEPASEPEQSAVTEPATEPEQPVITAHKHSARISDEYLVFIRTSPLLTFLHYIIRS